MFPAHCIRNAGAAITLLVVLAAGASAACAQATVLRYGQAPSAARSIFSLPVAVAEREDRKSVV